MARRRLRRKQAKDLRHQPSFTRPSPASDVVVACEARRVERLAYNRTQAAQALGISRSTFNRRVLPHVDLIEMPWGAKLVPVDELERLLAERRRRRQAHRCQVRRVGRHTSRRTSFAVSTRNTRLGAASARSPPASMPTASQPPTAARAGGHRLYAPFCKPEPPDEAHTDSVSTTRSSKLGPAARPVAVPEDLDNPTLPKAAGRVELPFHIRWSGPATSYDLDDPSDRARVYEQVLREGTEGDIRYYVDAEQLRELWDELVLPPPVRQAWTSWIERHRRTM
jgi:hypothetical protein